MAIIARDEADRIAACIQSVPFADDILVVDSGSTDGTPERARALGARVIETDWPGHVAQKNRALDAAAHDWVLSLDADECVDDVMQREIVEIMRGEPPAGAYRCRRLTWWEGAPMRHGTWYPDWRVRLFDRRRARWTGMNPHDHVETSGLVGDLRGHLHHHPYRDLGEHLSTIDRYSATFAVEAQRAGLRARWWDVAFRPPAHLLKAMVLRSGWADGVRGAAVAGLGATYVLLKWSRLYLAQRGRGGERGGGS